MENATPDSGLPQDGLRMLLAQVEQARGRADDATFEALLRALDSEYWGVRHRATELLAEQREFSVKRIQERFAQLSEAQRQGALIVVARVLGEGALPWLRSSYENPSATVRQSVLRAVSEIPGNDAVDFLVKALEDDSWLNRYSAAEQLQARGDGAVPRLKAGFAEGRGDLKFWCLQLLIRIFGQGAANFLAMCRRNEDPDIRHAAIRALGDIEESWVTGQLVEFLTDRHFPNRQLASRQLAARGKQATEALYGALKSGSPEVIFWAMQTLSRIGDEAMIKPVVAAVLGAEGDRAPDVRAWGVDALGTLKDEQATRRLLELAGEFADLRPRIAGHLPGAGAMAVPGLMKEAQSAKPEMRTFARGVLDAMGIPSLKKIVQELEGKNRVESDAFFRAMRALPVAKLDEMLRRADAGIDAIVQASKDATPDSTSSMTRITMAHRALTKDQADAAVSAGDAPRSNYPLTLDAILLQAINANASDIHLKPGLPPIFRVDGKLGQTPNPPMSPADTQEIIRSAISEVHLKTLVTRKELDSSYEIPGVSRFRLNCFSEMNGMGMVARVIPNSVPTLADLEMPRVFKGFCNYLHGILLICGPTGSGKSTTLAAMIDYINETREEHILTIEDPVEFRHPHKKCLITSRELGTNTLSFANALRSALREDPDIILVGELRDFETIELAVTAAETGHLVLSTLHTGTSAEAIDRLVNCYPAEQQQNARVLLASVLKAVVCQMLIPAIDGTRIPVLEILINNFAVANLIREKKMANVDQVIISGRKDGMQSRDDHLIELARANKIAPGTALEYALSPLEMQQKLGRRGV